MKWEYYTAKLPLGQDLFSKPKSYQKSLTEQLNQAGENDWELVSCFDTNNFHGGSKEIVLVFKRPKNLT